MVYTTVMGTSRNSVRRSISLPSPLAKRVAALARKRSVSANRVLVDLVQTGVESQEREKARFFGLADRLVSSKDPAEQRRVKAELARLTFGE